MFCWARDWRPALDCWPGIVVSRVVAKKMPTGPADSRARGFVQPHTAMVTDITDAADVARVGWQWAGSFPVRGEHLNGLRNYQQLH